MGHGHMLIGVYICPLYYNLQFLVFSTSYRWGFFGFWFFFPKLEFFEDKKDPTHVRTSELLPSVSIFSWKEEELNESKPASNEEDQIPA